MNERGTPAIGKIYWEYSHLTQFEVKPLFNLKIWQKPQKKEENIALD